MHKVFQMHFLDTYMKTSHFSFIPPFAYCRVCIPDQPGRKFCNTCHGGRILVCSECNSLSNLDCPDCSGTGRVRQVVYSSWDEVPIQQVQPCLSCSKSGKVYCEGCLGIGCIRCPDCRGLGHVKCTCSVQIGYSHENL